MIEQSLSQWSVYTQSALGFLLIIIDINTRG